MPFSIPRPLNRLLARSRHATCADAVGGNAKRVDAVSTAADRLIGLFRDEAYFEARDRAKGRCIDGAGSPHYWTRVKLEIARRQNIAIGLSAADMRA
jgi:hypothetical protein